MKISKIELVYHADLILCLGRDVVDQLELAYTQFMCPRCTAVNDNLCYVCAEDDLLLTGGFKSFVAGYLLGKEDVQK